MASVKKLVGSAALLGVGTFLAKLIGAIYRIPLTSVLTPTGLGIYQMVFPVYTVLLDFSGAGVPSALSKLISSFGENKKVYARKYLAVALKLLFVFGVLGFLIMLIFSKPFSIAQGNKDAYLGYIFLAPSVLLVSLISCFRGYFQGQIKMSPTAISQVIEQTVKLGFGLLFCFLLMPNVKRAVAGATFAITLSELIALLYLYILYRRDSKDLSRVKPFDKKEILTACKNIIKTTIPITLLGVLIPLSQVIDSFLTLNMVGSYRPDATALYGILSGVVMTIIHLPVSVCYGISAVIIPTVSGENDPKVKEQNIQKSLMLTMLVSLFCSVGVYLFSKTIIGVVFPSLKGKEYEISYKLLKLCSFVILYHAIVQTINGIFIGKSKPYLALIGISVGVVVKIVFNAVLLKNPSINIYGGAIAIIACYFSACLVNLIILFILKVRNDSKEVKYQRLPN